jgi:membrane-associated protein
VVHFDEHLRGVVSQYGTWTYAILFIIIFAETGIVIAPFLPGDSLLFAAGAIAGDPSMNLSVTWLCILLSIAAILGDTVNYHLGLFFGPRVFKNPKSFWLNPAHLEKTQAFFDRYGGKTIILARFIPIVRTFAPFVAGVGKMNYFYFLFYNVIGGLIWVLGFVLLGYRFGQLEYVKKNFLLVVIAIILLSILPAVYEYVQHLRSKQPPNKAK